MAISPATIKYLGRNETEIILLPTFSFNFLIRPKDERLDSSENDATTMHACLGMDTAVARVKEKCVAYSP